MKLLTVKIILIFGACILSLIIIKCLLIALKSLVIPFVILIILYLIFKNNNKYEN